MARESASGGHLVSVAAPSHRDLPIWQRADDLAKMANVHILTKPFDMKALEELVGRLLTP